MTELFLAKLYVFIKIMALRIPVEWLRFFHTWGVEMSPVVIVHRNTYVQAYRFFTAKYSTSKSTTLRAANDEVLKQSLTTVYLVPRVSYHVKARLSIKQNTGNL
jgi:hypothetical protein